jgi:hypothetical protein
VSMFPVFPYYLVKDRRINRLEAEWRARLLRQICFHAFCLVAKLDFALELSS